MLKKEILAIPRRPKPKHCITLHVSEKMREEVREAAKELGCSVSEYMRILHKFAQE